mmetsp:Transcript_44647/g.129937  ORF Transcript_44647/g.129937 Transcript_44647/m.129937 type:complete len:274 (+) Transcript_44647:1122-1943(+)
MLHGDPQRRQPCRHSQGPAEEFEAGNVRRDHLQPVYVLLLHDLVGRGRGLSLLAGNTLSPRLRPRPALGGRRRRHLHHRGDRLEPLPARGEGRHHHLIAQPGLAVLGRGTAPAQRDRQGQNPLVVQSLRAVEQVRRAQKGARGHVCSCGPPRAHREARHRRPAVVDVLPRGIRLHELLMLRAHMVEVAGMEAKGHPAEEVALVVLGHVLRRFRRVLDHHVHHRPMVGIDRVVPCLRLVRVHQLEARGARLGQRDRWNPIPVGVELSDQARGQC